LLDTYQKKTKAYEKRGHEMKQFFNGPLLLTKKSLPNKQTATGVKKT